MQSCFSPFARSTISGGPLSQTDVGQPIGADPAHAERSTVASRRRGKWREADTTCLGHSICQRMPPSNNHHAGLGVKPLGEVSIFNGDEARHAVLYRTARHLGDFRHRDA